MMSRVWQQMFGQGQGQVGVALHVPPDGHQEGSPGLVGHDLVHQPTVHLAPALLQALTLWLS